MEQESIQIGGYHSTLQVWQDDRGWHVVGDANNNGKTYSVSRHGTYTDIVQVLTDFFRKTNPSPH